MHAPKPLFATVLILVISQPSSIYYCENDSLHVFPLVVREACDTLPNSEKCTALNGHYRPVGVMIVINISKTSFNNSNCASEENQDGKWHRQVLS